MNNVTISEKLYLELLRNSDAHSKFKKFRQALTQSLRKHGNNSPDLYILVKPDEGTSTLCLNGVHYESRRT